MKQRTQNIKVMKYYLHNMTCCSMLSMLFLLCLFGNDARAQSVITYAYDAQGRLTSESYEGAYTLDLEYDEEGNMINKAVSDTLFIPGNKSDAEFVVYPNPASNGFVINYVFTQANVPEKMTLHDSNGKIIKKIPVNGTDGVIHYKDKLAPGVYILKAGDLHSQKIVIL